MTDDIKIGNFSKIGSTYCDLSKISSIDIQTEYREGRCSPVTCTCRELFFGGCSGGSTEHKYIVINCGGTLIKELVHDNAEQQLKETVKKYAQN